MSAVSPTLTLAWRRALAAIVIVELILIAIFFDTASGMVEIWIRSETFNHALLVPPISLWLIWEKRHLLARIPPVPSLWLLLPFVAASFAWLLGELAAVNAVTQFALIGMIILAVPLVVGVASARPIAFALGFLLFSVPFGEFVMPTLMNWTSHFTVMGLRASGIPVYQEGLHFVIPSGRWSVVEACSGVRYLIASIVVGTLFAYLSYRSLKRRLIFVGVSIAVPLVANWFRAYMIVMLGHLSGNKLAVGVDHLIYGWVFFGIVIMIMFAVGLRWREDDMEIASTGADSVLPNGQANRSRSLVAVALLLAVAMVPRVALTAMNQRTVGPLPVLDPQALVASGWQLSSSTLTSWQPHFQNPTAVMNATLTKGDHRVAVTIFFYRQQDHDRKLISSENVVVTNNDPQWIRLEQSSRDIAFANHSLTVRGTRLKSGGVGANDSAQLVVWNWYWIDGKWTASDPIGKLEIAMSKLMGRGDASAAVFISALEPDAERSLSDFLATAGDGIDKLLRQTVAPL